MIEIEFEKPDIYDCNCCDNKTVRLTRFVYKDGDAHAVYYSQYTIGHKEKVVNGVLSLGKWWEGSTPADRIAFPFRIWMNEGEYLVGLMDKAECQWADVKNLGEMLDRKDGLEHPWIKEVFHITNHIVTEDEPIIDYLNA
ncbi:hypothetical protein V6R21_18730 [Limibacter armeniacum]|uniref:hypothetical protein n=1 Tax=Limibacter armeniacum TaxID=466084 RepID=UPI002FE5121A